MTLMRHMYGLADIPLAYNTWSRGISESKTSQTMLRLLNGTSPVWHQTTGYCWSALQSELIRPATLFHLLRNRLQYLIRTAVGQTPRQTRSSDGHDKGLTRNDERSEE